MCSLTAQAATDPPERNGQKGKRPGEMENDPYLFRSFCMEWTTRQGIKNTKNARYVLSTCMDSTTMCLFSETKTVKTVEFK